MVGHLLGNLQLAAVAQVLGDAGGSEAVAAEVCADAGHRSASAHHSEDVGLSHRRV